MLPKMTLLEVAKAAAARLTSYALTTYCMT